MIGNRTGRAALVAIVGASLALAGACGGDAADDAAVVDTSTIAAAAGDTMAGGMMSDAQIVSQVTAANTAEMAASSVAADRAADPRVKEFAQRMVDEHQAAQGQMDSLAVRLGVATEVPTTDTLAQAFERRRIALEEMSGAAFDREYVTMQVEMHQSTLDLLNQSVAATQSADLRATLEAMIPTVQSHLDQARELQEQLGQG